MEYMRINDESLIKDVFAIQQPKSFATLQEQLMYAMSSASDLDMNSITPLESQLINSLSDTEKEILGLKGESPIPSQYLHQPKFRDTSLGGNDAVNCYPQFHEDDDLVHPINSIDGQGNEGLGRAYEEIIDRNQQILWLTFGTYDFCNIKDFYLTAINTQLAHLMNTGDQWSAFEIGNVLGQVVGFVATLPLKPFVYMYNLISSTFSDKPISTRYIEFKPAMPLYYRIVNTQIAILAVNMGLTKPEKYFDESPGEFDRVFDMSQYESQNKKIADKINQVLNQNADEISGEDMNLQQKSKYNKDLLSNQINQIDESGKIQDHSAVSNIQANGLPYLFTKYGLDILHILAKKDLYDKRAKVTDMESLDDYIKEITEAKNGSSKFYKDFVSGFMSGTYESMAFVGFRIEKSTNSSESVSNSVSMPEIANSVNSKIQSVRSSKTTIANFNLSDGIIGDIVGGAFDALKGFMHGALDQFNLSGIASLFTGAGLVDFQEIWQDSNFSKSYSFNVKLRAISGTKVAIIYKMIVLILLLAGSLPRATGRSSYTYPFLVRAYCPGKFAVPIGIIDSLSITRGSDEFGWSVDGLPLNIDVSFTIKDLSPCMFLGLADSASWKDILGQNTSFSEYLMTLSGMSVQDRLLKSRNIKRRIEVLLKLSRTVKFNPMMWGFKLSNNTTLGHIACAISPISKLPS